MRKRKNAPLKSRNERKKWKNKMNEVSSAFEKGGTLVVADTHNQIGKAILCLKKYREGEDNKNKKFAVTNNYLVHQTMTDFFFSTVKWLQIHSVYDFFTSEKRT